MIGTLMAKRAIAGAFDALNAHDLEQFMAGWREDGMFVFPGDIPESGTYQGKPAVAAWFQRFFEQFPEIGFEIEDVCVRNSFDLVGNNVLAVHWKQRLTNREGWTSENSGVTVITVRGGKVAAVRDFLFDTGSTFRRSWGVA
ncbi:MAG: nuclear transport factor 2 family protein [Anaerolineae bacterium]